MKVYFTTYPIGSGELTVATDMPLVPRAGDTVHISMTGDPEETRAWQVVKVSWVYENGEWQAELWLK